MVMIIHKIENRLAEETYVALYIQKLKKLMERIDQRLSQMFKKINKEGNWSNAELAKYNRAIKLREQIRGEIKKYSKDFTSSYRNDLAKLYKKETLFTQKILKQLPKLGITEGQLDTLPTRAIKSEVVDLVMIKGKTMREYVSKYGQDVAFKVEQEVFESIALGENPRETARRLKHLESRMMNRVEMTVRSWNLAIYNQANMMVYKQADIKQVLYLATLDARTCPECFSDHNEIYRIENAPALPRHPQCRCTLAPYIKGMVDKAREYDDWLRDGRRSDKQLKKIKNGIESYMKSGKITEKEGKHLIGIINYALDH